MPAKYTSIGLERQKFDELLEVKEQWQRRAGRRFYWGDFLMMLVTLQERPVDPVPTAELHQDEQPLSEEQLRAEGFEYDEALTQEFNRTFDRTGTLSEEEIESIAKRVAELVIEKLRASGVKSHHQMLLSGRSHHDED